MLRLDRTTRTLRPVERRSLAEAGILERRDLQALLRQSAQQAFREIGEDLLIVGEEVSPSDVVADRIDLLGLDGDGQTVIIELKRGRDRLQHLQAMSYAGFIRRWDRDKIISALAASRQIDAAEARELIEGHLVDPDAPLNTNQRIILLAEGFDAALLAAVEWLTERHRVKIACCTVGILEDADAQFLELRQVYPAIAVQPAIRAGRGAMESQPIGNEELARFMAAESVKPNRRVSGNGRVIRYWLNGWRRFNLRAQNHFATVHQIRRFPDDRSFWQERLVGQPDFSEPRGGMILRFRLTTPADFERFAQAFDTELDEVVFSVSPAEEPSRDLDDEGAM